MAHMEAQVRAMEADFALPVNPYRRVPTDEQLRYARDLCESELQFPERTLHRLPGMSRHEIKGLIDSLARMRRERVARMKRNRRVA